MDGFFGDEDALLFEINLITSDGLELPVDAMLLPWLFVLASN